MEESCYAIVQELGKTCPILLFEGRQITPSDIAENTHHEYFRILSLSDGSGTFSAKNLHGYPIMAVQKILGTKEGDIQWRVLN